MQIKANFETFQTFIKHYITNITNKTHTCNYKIFFIQNTSPFILSSLSLLFIEGFSDKGGGGGTKLGTLFVTFDCSCLLSWFPVAIFVPLVLLISLVDVLCKRLFDPLFSLLLPKRHLNWKRETSFEIDYKFKVYMLFSH